ncbi:MAG: hypothetical protein CMH54_04285 [Myxococcales bacterium]|nr:hypothetical protein [Myxococcales bacterium]
MTLIITLAFACGGSEAAPDMGNTTADEGSNDAGTTDEGVADEGTADEGATDEGATDEGAADEGAADEGTDDEGATDEGVADEGAADEGATDEGAADEGATDEGTATVGYESHAKAVLETYCSGCHSGAGFGGHNIASSYDDTSKPVAGSYTACADMTVGECSVLRAADGSMPTSGVSVPEADMQILHDWQAGGFQP